MKKLPLLASIPTHHPDCCAAISSVLVAAIAQILPPKPSLTISIGSGTGLLEALLLQRQPSINLKAVEVSSHINQYLPNEKMDIVSGTWDLCLLAGDAIAWMFIYPREVSLVGMYLERFSLSNTRLLLWIGPCADFCSIQSFIPNGWKIEIIENSTPEYEIGAIWRRIPENTMIPPIKGQNMSIGHSMESKTSFNV